MKSLETFWNTDLGERPGLLEFYGPDTVRFLNGQLTQDVRLVSSSKKVIPSCVTDAKGKLQFRIWLVEGESSESVIVLCREEDTSDLENRLTRYLISDQVEVINRSGEFSVTDFGGLTITEHQRVSQLIPKWGFELYPGILPPEAGLDQTDISYNKGCYIGQEIISRIKSAGKLNRKLTKFTFNSNAVLGEFHDFDGNLCGEITSISAELALGYLKKGFENTKRFRIGDLELSMF